MRERAARRSEEQRQQAARDNAKLEGKLRRVFGFDAELTERMTQARFVARQTEDFSQAVKVYRSVLQERLTEEERRELIDMLEDVAGAEGGPSDGQADAIDALKRAIGLSPAH